MGSVSVMIAFFSRHIISKTSKRNPLRNKCVYDGDLGLKCFLLFHAIYRLSLLRLLSPDDFLYCVKEFCISERVISFRLAQIVLFRR